MSEFKNYSVDIISPDASDLEKILATLEEKHIVPEILRVAMLNTNPKYGAPILTLDSDAAEAAGSLTPWNEEEYESLFHELSLQFPKATFDFFDMDVNDLDACFKKSFHNGLFKAASRETASLDDILDALPWVNFGEESVQPGLTELLQQRQTPLVIKIIVEDGVVQNVLVDQDIPVQVEVVAVDKDYEDYQKLDEYRAALLKDESLLECEYSVASFEG